MSAAVFLPYPDEGLMPNERTFLEVSVARVEEQQKALVEKLDSLNRVLSSIDSRVTSVEEFKWKIIGISLAVGALSAISTRLLTKLLS